MRFLGAVVGQFGECLGTADTYADGNARPLPYPLPDLLAIVDQVTFKAGQIKEGFVDRVNFLFRRKLSDNRVHALAHIPIERVVATSGNDAVLLGEVAQIEPW